MFDRITRHQAAGRTVIAGGLLALLAAFNGVPEGALPHVSIFQPELDRTEPVDDAEAQAALEALVVVEEPAPLARSLGSGRASYYGRRFAGRPTASGEIFDPTELTAAHRTLPFGSMVRVTYPVTGESVTVRVNDRGPFHGKRVIDLSRAAAEELGLVKAGVATVELELLTDS